MKTCLKIATIFHVLLLLSLLNGSSNTEALGGSTKAKITYDTARGDQPLLVEVNLLSQGNPLENLFSLQTPAFPSFHKKSFFDFIAFIRSKDQRLLSTFSQYSFFATKLMLRFGTSDLIFPFHSFW